MEVRDAKSKLLCNFEVLRLLKEVKDEKRTKKNRGLSTVVYECIRALESGPCKYQTSEAIAKFMEFLRESGLNLAKVNFQA